MSAGIRPGFVSKLSLLGAFLLIGFALFRPSIVQAGGKVSPSPASTTIAEGSSQDFNIQLDAPIICPGGAPVCQVEIDMTPTDPGRVSISPSPVIYAASDWSQIKTFTVTALPNATQNDNETVTINMVASSASVYYNNFTASVSINITDTTPPKPAIVDKTTTVASGSNTVVDVLTGIGGNPDSSTLTVVSGPSHGTAVDPPGTITYTPNKGYIGSDSLTYQVCSSLNAQVCNQAVLGFNVVAASPNTGFGINNPISTPEILAIFTLACGTMFALAAISQKRINRARL